VSLPALRALVQYSIPHSDPTTALQKVLQAKVSFLLDDPIQALHSQAALATCVEWSKDVQDLGCSPPSC